MGGGEMHRVWGGLLAANITCLAGSAHAAYDSGVLTLLIENDAFADTDRNYTSGLKLAYVAPEKRADPLRNYVQSNLWPGGNDTVMRSSISIGQSIFTPRDTSVTFPQPNDRPYAGWLYLGYGIIAERPSNVTTADIELGIIGPDAGGEWVQNDFHDLLGNGHSEGWDNQLEDQFGINLTVERRWRPAHLPSFLGIEADMEPNVGVTLGNVVTEAFVGGTIRLGTHLERSALPLRVRPSLAGSGSFDETTGIGWYVFIGGTARAVGYNVFLEGDTPYVSNVDPNTFVFDGQAGIALRLGRFQVTYTFVERSEEFTQQDGEDHFGALGFSWHF